MKMPLDRRAARAGEQLGGSGVGRAGLPEVLNCVYCPCRLKKSGCDFRY